MRIEEQISRYGKDVSVFDENDRILRFTEYDPSGNIERDIYFEYDGSTDSSGYYIVNSHGITTMRQRSYYNKAGRNTEETWYYNAEGQLIKRSVESFNPDGRLTIVYDAANNEISREQGRPRNHRFYRIRDAAYNNLAEAQTLVQEDPAYLNERNGIGETAFHFLVVENAMEGVQWLLAQG